MAAIKRSMLALLFLLPGLLVPSASSALALCDGVTDDTAAIQAAIQSRTPLPRGVCVVSATLQVGEGEALIGQGALFDTVLAPTASMVGQDVVRMHCCATGSGRPRVSGVMIHGRQDVVLGVALRVVEESGAPFNGQNGIDMFQIDHVHINLGRYSLAFLCQNVHSSRMDFVQIYNYQAGTFAAAWHGCTDWTLTQVEVHSMASTACCAGPVWSWFGSSNVRFVGGNQSIMGSAPSYQSPDNFITGPGVVTFATTQYRD